MPVTSAKGWAIVENGKINVRSICPTRVGAMVNFLCTERGLVIPQMSDARVEGMFVAHRGKSAAWPREVLITVIEPASIT